MRGPFRSEKPLGNVLPFRITLWISPPRMAPGDPLGVLGFPLFLTETQRLAPTRHVQFGTRRNKMKTSRYDTLLCDRIQDDLLIKR